MWKRIVIIVLLSAIAVGSLRGGFQLRRYLYTTTDDIRFVRNVENAWMWGRNARAEGVFNIYQKVLDGERYQQNFELDYPPLRLLTASLWQGWTERHFPDAPKQWQRSYEYTAPMLWTNTIAAALAGAFVFLLIRMWTIRADDARRAISRNRSVAKQHSTENKGVGSLSLEKTPDPFSPHAPFHPRAFRGVVAGMIGAMLMWLNPAMLWDGYVWVQWDIWPMPFFLAAVYLACLNRWFGAGMCLAVGASFKGQMLIAAPVMLVWPIFQLRFGAVFRLIAGAAIMFMAIVFPWMKPSVGAGVWSALTLCAMAILIPFVLRANLKMPWLIACAVAALLLVWPWTSKASIPLRMLPTALIGSIALSRYLPARAVPHLYALSVALIVLLMIPLYDANTAWFTRGFQFGAEHNKQMHGAATYNLPALLQTTLRWPNSSMYEFTEIPMFKSITMRTLMGSIHGILLLLCGIAAARHYRNGDPRFLLAISLPWLLFYMLLTQMYSRYLVYGAALGALLPALGAGPALLGLVVTAIALLSVMQNHYQLANVNPWAYPWLPNLQTLLPLEPGIGWMLVLVSLILLYLALAPRGWIRTRASPRPKVLVQV